LFQQQASLSHDLWIHEYLDYLAVGPTAVPAAGVTLAAPVSAGLLAASAAVDAPAAAWTMLHAWRQGRSAFGLAAAAAAAAWRAPAVALAAAVVPAAVCVAPAAVLAAAAAHAVAPPAALAAAAALVQEAVPTVLLGAAYALAEHLL
jgi:hypothetical protein